jgi:hypothetical protein
MSRVEQPSRRKRRSKAAPILRAAGLSLTVASEASLASAAAALDTMTRDAGVSHEITLREEEVRDISLATFHVFDKEGAKASGAGERPVTLGQGCCLFACLGGQSPSGFEGSSAHGNDAYSPRPRRPTHKPSGESPRLKADMRDKRLAADDLLAELLFRT